MAKLTLTDIAAGYALVATINANNALIEAALENTVSRDGTTPNTLSDDLDMNSNKINNLTDGTAAQDAITKAQLDAVVLAAGAITSLPNLTDVDSAAVTAGFALMADGANYVGRALLEADISDLQAYLTAESNDLTAAVVWDDIPDGNVPESAVTQHRDAVVKSTINVQNVSYTTVLTDADDIISKESGGAGETFTIDSNANVAYPVGTKIGFNNDGGGTLSIAITTDTLVFADDNTTGTRTLGDGGFAVAVKVTTTKWKIAGRQLT